MASRCTARSPNASWRTASTEPVSPIGQLRAATCHAHDAVDAVFGAHDLADPASYRRFLLAHARALPVAEARMRALAFARTLDARTPLLAEDLADLGAAMPPPLALALEGADDEPARWGTLYVVEGSRLGGGFLARSVPAVLPHRYLGATHPPGQWRTIRDAIDAAGAGKDAAWHAAMVAGALACFDLYARAANMAEP